MEELEKAQLAAEMAEYGLTIEFREAEMFKGKIIRVNREGMASTKFTLIEFNAFILGLRISKLEKPKKKEASVRPQPGVFRWQVRNIGINTFHFLQEKVDGKWYTIPTVDKDEKPCAGFEANYSS